MSILEFNGGIVLLAAGYSKRFSENKAFVRLGSDFLIDIAVSKIQNLGYDFAIIANENNYEYLKNKYKNAKIIKNFANSGQASSIKLGVKYFKNKDWLMFMPIDQPLLKKNTIKNIITHFKKNFIIIPRFAGRKALPTIFSSEYFDELLDISGDEGGKKIAKKYTNYIINVEIIDAKEALDIDTQEDLINIRRYL